MKLALSGRLWETPQTSATTLLQQIQIAAELSYQGIEARYPLVPEAGEWDAIEVALNYHNIELVFAAAAGVPSTPEALEDLVHVFDFLQYCGGKFLKLISTQEGDYDAMWLAAELTGARGIRVLTQLHANTANGWRCSWPEYSASCVNSNGA